MNPSHKFVMFAAHDTTIMPLLASLLGDNWDKECGPRVLVSFQLVDYGTDFKIKA